MNKFNFNDVVEVTLSDSGKEKAIRFGVSTRMLKKVGEKWVMKTNLWEIMNIFGADMFMGNPDLPFEMDAKFVK